MTEKQFEDRQVKPFLKNLNKCWFFKVHGGSMFQVAGIPDIVGVVNGRLIALELKADNGKPSPLQLRHLDLIDKAGGYARLVYPRNWEDIKKELENLCNNLMIID